MKTEGLLSFSFFSFTALFGAISWACFFVCTALFLAAFWTLSFCFVRVTGITSEGHWRSSESDCDCEELDHIFHSIVWLVFGSVYRHSEYLNDRLQHLRVRRPKHYSTFFNFFYGSEDSGCIALACLAGPPRMRPSLTKHL